MTAANWLLAYLFAAFVVSPVLTLLHELGHALVALARRRALVSVELGRQPPLARLALGQLTLAVTPWPGHLGITRADYDDETPVLHRVVGALAGPAVSAACTAGLCWLAVTLDDPWRPFAVVSGFLAAFQLIVTAFPFTYPASWGAYAGMPSDGLRAIRIARSRHAS